MARPGVRRLAGAGLLLALVGSSCDSAPVLEPEVVERVEVCDDLVPIGVELVKRLVAAVEGAPLEMVTGEVPPSEELAGLQSVGTEIDRRAARLGCDPHELNAGINERTADLETEDPVAGILLEIVRGGVVSSLPPPPATTTTTSNAP